MQAGRGYGGGGARVRAGLGALRQQAPDQNFSKYPKIQISQRELGYSQTKIFQNPLNRDTYLSENH
jgi:hypothetical protein